MDEHIQLHAALTDVAEHAGGTFSGLKGIFGFFANEAPNVAN